MTILDPVVASNLAVYLVQLPSSRAALHKVPAGPPIEFLSLQQARTAGVVSVRETGIMERIRFENLSDRDIFIQAGEILHGGYQDRAVAGDLIIPAPHHGPESHMLPVLCVEEQRWNYSLGPEQEEFTHLDQTVPRRKLKKEVRFGTQDDVWREVAALSDILTDIISYGGTRPVPRMSLWELMEMLEIDGSLTKYLYSLLPLGEKHPEATGAVFLIDGKINSAELYATPALFRQMWPKLLWAISVEALIEQNAVTPSTAKLPTKGEVTAWLAAVHARRATRHTDVITKRTHRRIRSIGSQMCFETLDQEQEGLCVHEFILAND
jgi:hypothetical protein